MAKNVTVLETVAENVQEKISINISEQLYDELGRPVIKTVTVARKDGSSFEFDSGFISQRDFSIWRKTHPQPIYELEGGITKLLDNRFDADGDILDNRFVEDGDIKYPYMATYYESSPLSRITQTTLPDKEFLYGSNVEALMEWLNQTSVPPASHSRKNYYGDLPVPIKAMLAKQLSIPPTDFNQHFKVGYQLTRLNEQEQVATAQVIDLLGRPVAQMTMNQNKTDFLLSSIRWSYVSAFACSNQVCAVMKEYSPPSNYLEGKPCKVNEYYDMGGRLIERTSDDEGSKQYYYDKAGRLVFMSDQQDDEVLPSGTRIKYHQYDSLNRLNKISCFVAPKTVWYSVATILAGYLADPSSLPPLNVLVEYIYDVTSAPAGGIELSMEETVLNNIGRLVKVVTSQCAPAGETEEYYAYNEVGDTIGKGVIVAPTLLSPFTQLTAYKYDNLKNVTSIYYPQRWDITETKLINYGALFPDTAPLIVAYDYNISGYLKSITGQDNRTPNQPPKTPEYAHYFYNPDRTLAAECLAAGKICRTREYNTLNQLEMINDQFISADPNQSKNVFSQKLAYRDQDTTGYRDGYIRSNNLTFFKPSTTESQPIAETTYSYSYDYDAYGRLKTVQLPGNIVNEQFDYSANGNILSHATKDNTVTYTYKNSNRLETVIINGTVGQYAYQPNGMLKSTPKWYGVNYNELNPYLPNTIYRRDTSQESFYYDNQGERLMLQGDAGGSDLVTIMYWRGLGIKPLVEDFFYVHSHTKQFYIYGLNGLLLFSNQVDAQSPWVDHYLLTDHAGSLRMALSQQQKGQYTVDACFDYTAYGEIINNNSWGNLAGFRYYYTGQERDSLSLEEDPTSSDLEDYNYHARLYDSQMGRFLAPDPGHQFPSPYVYAGNNPVNYVDVSGNVTRPLSDVLGAFSENKTFFIPDTGNQPGNLNIWIESGTNIVANYLELQPLRMTRSNTNNRYTIYTTTKRFPQDCLQLAENIINQQDLQHNDNSPAYSREILTGKKFGIGDKKNISIADEIAKKPINLHGINAVPEVGQAFVTIKRGNGAGVPYHAAAVVFKDENDRITFETDAGNRRTDGRGIFDMYQVGNNQYSFFNRYKDLYKTNTIEPVTSVLRGPKLTR
ncbi:MAG: RHS repeat-associated core domain-containing protein [Gammaproteobacteria bacterium]